MDANALGHNGQTANSGADYRRRLVGYPTSDGRVRDVDSVTLPVYARRFDTVGPKVATKGWDGSRRWY